MSIRTFDFAYGRGRKTFELDDELILKEVRTETFPVMENVAEGVLEAIHRSVFPRSRKSSSPATPSPSSATIRRASRTALTSCPCS